MRICIWKACACFLASVLVISTNLSSDWDQAYYTLSMLKVSKDNDATSTNCTPTPQVVVELMCQYAKTEKRFIKKKVNIKHILFMNILVKACVVTRRSILYWLRIKDLLIVLTI